MLRAGIRKTAVLEKVSGDVRHGEGLVFQRVGDLHEAHVRHRPADLAVFQAIHGKMLNVRPVGRRPGRQTVHGQGQGPRQFGAIQHLIGVFIRVRRIFSQNRLLPACEQIRVRVLPRRERQPVRVGGVAGLGQGGGGSQRQPRRQGGDHAQPRSQRPGAQACQRPAQSPSPRSPALPKDPPISRQQPWRDRAVGTGPVKQQALIPPAEMISGVTAADETFHATRGVSEQQSLRSHGRGGAFNGLLVKTPRIPVQAIL